METTISTKLLHDLMALSFKAGMEAGRIEAGTAKATVTKNAGRKRYHKAIFDGWIASGQLELYQMVGNHQHYLVMCCELLQAQDSLRDNRRIG